MNLALRPRRVPILWILIPFAAGLVVARVAGSPPAPWIALAAVALCVASLTLSKSSNLGWQLCFTIGAFCIGLLRFQTSPLADLSSLVDFPPREAEIVFEIDTLFSTSDPSYALGIGRIVTAPPYLETTHQARLYFALDVDPHGAAPKVGETHRGFGVLRPNTDSGEANSFARYLSNQGVSLTLKQGFFRERVASAHTVIQYMDTSREHLAALLSRNKQPEGELTGAFKALMLGQKSELTPQQKDLFLSNGAMHLFAISGLHIGVIAMCIHQLLIMLRLKGGLRVATTLAMVTLFVLVTGGSASSWRALLMIACLYLSHHSRRQSSPLSALALSALIYLLILPGQLFQAGFQMSYFTVASILLFGLPFGRSLNRHFALFAHTPSALQSKSQRILVSAKTWFFNSLAISASAFISSSLLGAYYFQLLPTYGILTNLVALPLASLAIVAGFLSILFGSISAILPVSDLFNNAALVLIATIQSFLQACRELPAASVATPAVPGGLIFTLLLLIVALTAVAYTRSNQPNALLWQCAPLLATAASLLIFL